MPQKPSEKGKKTKKEDELSGHKAKSEGVSAQHLPALSSVVCVS